MGEASNTSSRSGMSRGLRLILVVSLGLNLLVLGLMGSALLMRDRWHDPHPGRLERMGGPLSRALTEDDRRAIGRQLRATYRDRAGSREAQRARIEALVADLKAEPFDAAAVELRLAQHRAEFAERLALGQTLLLDHLRQMDAADRAAFADRLRDGAQHRWSRRDRSDHAGE